MVIKIIIKTKDGSEAFFLFHYPTTAKTFRIQISVEIISSAGIVSDFSSLRIICYKRVELELDLSKCTKLKTRGSKMPQKAGCAGRNMVTDCCN